LPTRWHDPEKDIGNLEPGQPAFRESPDRIVETIPATPHSWDEIIAAHRQANRTAAPRPRATAAFNSHRSLRRV
jgi:hypothetical protein